MDIQGFQRARGGKTPDLGDDNAAIIMRRHGQVESPQIGALLLVSQVAAFVGGGRPDNGDLGHDGLEIEPVLAVKIHVANNRRRRRVIHGAALAVRINEGIQPHLGQNAGAFGRSFPVHVKEDARGHIVGGDRVVGDHLTDQWRGGGGRTRGVGAAQGALQQPLPGDVIDALDAPHIPRRNGVQRGEVLWMTGRLEMLADGGQHRVGAAQAAGGRDGDNGLIGDESGCSGRGYDL